MVTAIVKGKHVPINNLDELAEVVESSRRAHVPLRLLGFGGRVAEIAPGDPDSDTRAWKPTAEQIENALATAGSWRGLVDTDRLKEMIQSGKGQRPRDWESCSS